MASFATSAAVLRAIDYGESDRVVTLFGRATGCVGAIARGARKSQRRFGGGLGLCAVGEAALRERAGSELMTLERFEVTASFPSLAADVARMGHAAYVAELVAKLCAPRQAEPGIFDWLIAFLGLLEAEGPSASRLRVFELGLLERLGFAPALDGCAVCGRADLDASPAPDDAGRPRIASAAAVSGGPGAPAARAASPRYDVRWDPGRGGVVCTACGARGRPMRPVVRVALARFARLPQAEARAVELVPDVARGCRDALQELIAGHLSAPLRSLEFLAKLPPGTAGTEP